MLAANLRTVLVLVLSIGFFGLAVLEAANPLEARALYYRNLLKNAQDSKTRVRAAEQLGAIGRIEAIYVRSATADLVQLSRDSDAKCRVAAAQALGRIDPDPQ